MGVRQEKRTSMVVLAGLLAASAEAGRAEERQVAQPDLASQLTQAAKPSRGLFGAGSPAQPGGHILDLTAAVPSHLNRWSVRCNAALWRPLSRQKDV